jgi:hypothetical protein
LPGKESHLVKTARLLILGSVLAILHVAAANAAVSVSHFVTQETVPVGGTFDVDVIAAYDGSPIMTGIFVSAGWDPAQLMLINTPTAPNFVIFCGGAGCLTKVADPGNFTGDPEGTLRTVQYGANPGQSGGAGDDVVITTLQFEVLSEGDGTAEVDVIFNSGDEFQGEGGVVLSPPDATVAGIVVTVPEPASAALAFSALGSVALIAGWRNRRR